MGEFAASIAPEPPLGALPQGPRYGFALCALAMPPFVKF